MKKKYSRKSKSDKPKPIKGKRACIDCYAELSMYNSNVRCFSCTTKKFTQERLSQV